MYNIYIYRILYIYIHIVSHWRNGWRDRYGQILFLFVFSATLQCLPRRRSLKSYWGAGGLVSWLWVVGGQMVMFKLNASGPPSFLLAFALAFLVERTNLFCHKNSPKLFQSCWMLWLWVSCAQEAKDLTCLHITIVSRLVGCIAARSLRQTEKSPRASEAWMLVAFCLGGLDWDDLLWDDPNLDLDHGTSWKIMGHLDVKTSHRRTKKRCQTWSLWSRQQKGLVGWWFDEWFCYLMLQPKSSFI